MENIEALKIHGYQFSSESDSDDCKSDFDYEYYKAKPPVQPINQKKIVRLEDGDSLSVSSYEGTTNTLETRIKSKSVKKNIYTQSLRPPDEQEQSRIVPSVITVPSYSTRTDRAGSSKQENISSVHTSSRKTQFQKAYSQTSHQEPKAPPTQVTNYNEWRQPDTAQTITQQPLPVGARRNEVRRVSNESQSSDTDIREEVSNSWSCCDCGSN